MKKLPLESTYSAMYAGYKLQFIEKYGREKFQNIFDTIIDSKIVKKLFIQAQNLNVAPAGKDYVNAILSMPYFIFAKNDTRIMGSLIALYIWDQNVNIHFKLKDIRQMGYTVDDIFGNLGVY
jgi:hypothetical protein